jgi:threonine dehydratase
MQCFVDAIVTVSEDEIQQALKLLSENPATVAEPSGAVATAGFLFRADQLPKTLLNVAIISGGNIEPKMLEDVRSH